jgi:type IV secretory pathway VirB10-like protein
VIGIAAAALAAIIVAWQLGSSGTEPVAEEPVKPPERSVAAATPAEPVTPEVTPLARPKETAAASVKTAGSAGTPTPTAGSANSAPAERAAQANPAPRSPTYSRPRAPAPRPKVRPTNGGSSRGRNEEPDVGY